ncbi:MAG: MutS-related protein [Myxococcota bacterium]
MTLPSTANERRELYRTREEAARSELAQLDRVSSWIAHGRAGTFLAAAALMGLSLFERLPSWGFVAGAGFLFAYGVLAWRHEQVAKAEARAKARVELNRRGLARLEGRWHDFPSKGERFADVGHLYTPDLDLFGQGSLFQLVDETGTRAGEEQLARWLSAPTDASEVRARQSAVLELLGLLDFRQALVTESRLAAKDKADPHRLIEWAEGPDLLAPIGWARPLAFVLPPVALALYLAGLSPWYWLVLAAQLAVVALTRRHTATFYERLCGGESGFVRFERTFATIERQTFFDPRLLRLRAGLQSDGPAVSTRFRRFSRLFAFVELRQSPQLHAVLNLALLWDVQWMFWLEAWRVLHGRHVRQWFEALAELEALSSIAGLAHVRPDFVFPQVEPGPPRFFAEALGHPLLDRPVTNDVVLSEGGEALLVTGSNMSGKTTLLRAMGLNTVMALCGMPVCAKALRLSQLEVLTSMRVKDSLERGVSYFYAEVQRMKAVLDAAGRGRALFLLDELFLGTNTRERQLASRELLRLLLATGSIGAVTTHDLALTELSGQEGFRLKNVHFRDLVEDGKMTFDYRLREGVVDTTNALRVLRLAGIPLSGE